MSLLKKKSVRLAIPAFQLPTPNLTQQEAHTGALSRCEMSSLFKRELRGTIQDQLTASETSESDRLNRMRTALYGGSSSR